MGIEITIKRGSDVSAQEIYDILKLRAAVFIVEFNGVFLDPDDQDLLTSVYQLMAKTESGELAGYLRLDPHKGSVHVRRVAVAKEHRGGGLAREMMIAAISFCKNKGYTQLTLSARAYLANFYASLDFVPVGEQYIHPQSHIFHQNMKLTL